MKYITSSDFFSLGEAGDRRAQNAAARLSERRAYRIDGFIEDQGDPSLKGLKYGKYPAAYNACECVAVYNALKYAGKNVGFAELLTEFEENGVIGYCLFGKHSPFAGKFGSNPRKLAAVLRHYGVGCVRTRREKTFRRRLENENGFIASFINKSCILNGVHTFFFCRENGAFRVYNGYGRRVCATFEDIRSSSRFLSGYALQFDTCEKDSV